MGDGIDSSASRSGTALYRAPELVGDAVPTALSDIYALGLILFQLAAGDFGRSLAPGWEEAVRDSVLRGDIAEAAAGDPEKRITSAALLADRLDHLEEHRAEAREAAAREAQFAALRHEEERRAARRPWVRAAGLAAFAGILATSAAAFVATRQRAEAERQGAISEASYGFLADDLLGRADPTKGQGVAETLADAAKRAATEIDRRFAREPLVAARLHATLGVAFQQRGDIAAMRNEFDAAERNFRLAGQIDSEDAAVARMTRAQAEATSMQEDGIKLAQDMIAAERKRMGPLADSGRVGFALAKAEGVAHYFDDLPGSEAALKRTIAYAQANSDQVSQREMLRIRTTYALVLMRQGRAVEAEPEMRKIVAEATTAFGADHPDTLNARQNLLNAIGLQHRDREVVAEAGILLPLFEKRYGPDHRLTLALLSTRGDSLVELGRYQDAAADALRVCQGASAMSGPLSHQALVGRLDMAMDQCRGGDLARRPGKCAWCAEGCRRRLRSRLSADPRGALFPGRMPDPGPAADGSRTPAEGVRPQEGGRTDG